MKNKIILILIFVYAASFAKSVSIELVSKGKSGYKIILSCSASHWDSLAAHQLQSYVKEISGAQIAIADDSVPSTEKEIIIGTNNRAANLDLSSIREDDGFIIRTDGSKIYFAGKRKGTLYAVSTFLEKYLNCRMYSAKVKVIPKRNSIILPQIDISENPVFSYRDIYYYETENDEYCYWHKLTDSDDKKMWGMFVHTFNTLLPPEKYFKEHPEYFALRDSLRVPEQPCLTNPGVFKIIVEELRRRMKENPSAKIWSVSQNDNYSNCQCNECKKIDEREGSPAGSLLNFINKIAKEFPGKIISTLAYQYSRKAPAAIRPEKNVNIMLCSIECYRTYPLETDTSKNSFTQDLIEWSKLTNNIFLWDYVVQFTNYVSPFPNFHVLQPNIQLFAKHGAKMMFQQGSGQLGGEFNELRAYLIAKLLWNPKINIDSVMNDFLSGYYGKAGKHIKSYIDLMTSSLIKSNAKLWIYDNPVNSMQDYLAPELIKQYNKIFDKAEKAAKNNSVFLERVKTARLPLKYAMLEQAKVIGEGDSGTFIKDEARSYKANPKIEILLDEFLDGCKRTGDVHVNEQKLNADLYVSRYKTMLSKIMKNPLGLFKPVKYLNEANWKYPANGEKSLTDGMRGDEDHHFNWVGFEGNDMEVVVDLQKNTTVKKVSADFLQISFSWVFFPEQFEISVSSDGKIFSDVSSMRNETPITKEETSSPFYSFIKNFSCSFNPTETRYVKVKAVNMKTCPRWHPGYPFKAWIFTDEIVIE
ncbi:MAG: DUF4838 domain-containing protein [Ignavibacteriales bacterium]|nr:DUF4838 domain-containing protein [Ignavibacteriales bacterium]